jgi:hypothetical protein
MVECQNATKVVLLENQVENKVTVTYLNTMQNSDK